MRLVIRNANVRFGDEVILDGIDFEINDKEKTAVVGRNGSGKTTLLKLISGVIAPEHDAKTVFQLAGKQSIGYLQQISFEDGSISVEDELKKVFADIYAIRDRMREVEAGLSETPDQRLLDEYAALQRRFDAAGGESCERDMLIMFQKFGFRGEDITRPIGTFSGGQQTKIAFMKLLLSRPDILLLDEPTNHLDLPAVEWLEGYLKSYPKAVVVVSHDREFLDNFVNVTYEIEYHRIRRYSGNYTAFVKQKEDNLIRQEKEYEAQQKEIKRLQDWIDKWKNTPSKVSSAHSKEKVLEHMTLIEKPRRFDTTTFRAYFSPRIKSFNEVLSVRGLQIGYDRLLSEVTFTLMRGERLAVIGENGKGKSTLLKTLTGAVAPLGGSFSFGQNVEWGYFDQQSAVINDEDPEKTVLESFWDEYPRLMNQQVRDTLGAFAFSGEETAKKLGQLSGGERVRLALCKMFYMRPNLLILDEPTNHMDILGRESLEKMLLCYDGTVIFVSHDRYFIKQVATAVLDFGENDVTFYGCGYEEYLEERAKRQAGAAERRPGTEKAAKVSGTRQLLKNPGKERARIERKIEKLENELAENEAAHDALSMRLEDPALSSDYEKLMELEAELSLLEEKQEELLGQIIEAEEALEVFNAAAIEN